MRALAARLPVTLFQLRNRPRQRSPFDTDTGIRLFVTIALPGYTGLSAESDDSLLHPFGNVYRACSTPIARRDPPFEGLGTLHSLRWHRESNKPRRSLPRIPDTNLPGLSCSSADPDLSQRHFCWPIDPLRGEFAKLIRDRTSLRPEALPYTELTITGDTQQPCVVEAIKTLPIDSIQSV